MARRARRRGHLRQHGNRWRVQFKVKGRQMYRSFPTRAEAELYLAQTEAALARGAFQVPERVSFAEAAEAWYRHGVHVGGARGPWKPSTARDYRSALDRWLLPTFGSQPLHDVSVRAIERWRTGEMATGRLPRRTAVKLTAILHSVFERARKEYGFAVNPAAELEPLRVHYDPASYDFYEPEEVWALVRAAASEQDGALYLTAAFAGLRLGELVALRVGDVDFQAQGLRVLGSVDPLAGRGTTKGGRGRSVPMVPDLAAVLARLLQRDERMGDDEPLFPGERGGFLDGSALRRRYRAAQARAGLRPLRFHDLRHTFGSLAARAATTTRELQEWMGHADPSTTARYLHYRSRGGEAARLAPAFAIGPPGSRLEANVLHMPAAPFRTDAAEDGLSPAQE